MLRNSSYVTAEDTSYAASLEMKKHRSEKRHLWEHTALWRIVCLISVIIAAQAFLTTAAYAGIHISNPYLKRMARLSSSALDPRRAPWMEEDIIEDAEPPLVIDWAEMQARNSDIIGYLYVDGMPNISYPIFYSGDDDFYLHHNINRDYEYRGSIFLEGLNRPDFADPNGFIYGHNMADGSMFGSLKFMVSQEKYDAHPYFWVLTSAGNYRYKIFSMMFVDLQSDVYLLYRDRGQAFKSWEKRWKKQSLVKNDVPLTTKDTTLTLTTCTSDANTRLVILGKCVSSEKPSRKKEGAGGGPLTSIGELLGWDQPADSSLSDQEKTDSSSESEEEGDPAEEIW